VTAILIGSPCRVPVCPLRRDAPVGGGFGWPGYAYVARTVRSLLPFLERVGAVRGEEVDIDTLEDRCAPRSPARTASNCFRPSWGPGLAPDLSASHLHEWAVSPFFWPEA
jgi:hypothetical protein